MPQLTPSTLAAPPPDAAPCVKKTDGEGDALDQELPALAVPYQDELQALVDERTAELLFRSRQLEDALLDKTNLLRIMAHDLRNYLAIAKWSSELAAAATCPIKRSHLFAKVKWAIDKQTLLINKVASMESLRSGKQTVVAASHRLADILQNLEWTFEHNLSDKDLSISVTWNCPLEQCIWVDAVLFADLVLNNIVSNAIKFSSPGDAIAISIIPVGPDHVGIKVRDFGIGIPQELMAKLFGVSDQTSRQGTRGEQGLGFGMPIAKLSLEKMAGRIEIRSTVKTAVSADHGTDVTLIVPARCLT